MTVQLVARSIEVRNGWPDDVVVVVDGRLTIDMIHMIMACRMRP